MKHILIGTVFLLSFILCACGEKHSQTNPSEENVTESHVALKGPADCAGTILEPVLQIVIEEGTVFAMPEAPWKTDPEETRKNQGWAEKDALTAEDLPFDPADREMQITHLLSLGESAPAIRIRNMYAEGRFISTAYDLYFAEEAEAKAWKEEVVSWYRKQIGDQAEFAEAGGKEPYVVFSLREPAQSDVWIRYYGKVGESPSYTSLPDDPEGYVLEITVNWATGKWASEHIND